MSNTKHDNKVFAFYEQLYHFYKVNRGKIRSRYNELTKKFLAYNDKDENPNAFLRRPQFEALEIYVFIKEFLKNAQVDEIFNLWSKREGVFSTASYYSPDPDGSLDLFQDVSKKETEIIFKQMKAYRENYPNYIFALAMGLGKTILMGTCIFYEFLLANKYPNSSHYCHNALVFAPDKTVRQSLKEIITFDKSKVIPPEYVKVLDANINYHFLDDDNSTLNTIDKSSFNIIISNNQKIIVQKRHRESSPAELIFDDNSVLAGLYPNSEEPNEDPDFIDERSLHINQRFQKITRLKQLGVYVDEAHHLFGAALEKEIRLSKSEKDKQVTKTSLRTTINLLAQRTTLVACYNFTGTPYVKTQVLPEVVYAYGLKEAIQNSYLKDVDIKGYENVKEKSFLKEAVKKFWDSYGNKTYEGLKPKIAFFASTIKEATDEVRPVIEEVLGDLGLKTDKILINVGDGKITKDIDIKNFNELDVPDSTGDSKQFIILVGKGREGWNCRSLFSVALFRSPKSKVFVLQATMRCLRQISDEQQRAIVFLSKDNMDILDQELKQNFNMDLDGLTNKTKTQKLQYKVRVLPPPRVITLKRVRKEYSIEEKAYTEPIAFKLDAIDTSKYQALVYKKSGFSLDTSLKVETVDALNENTTYSLFSLVGEVSRYMNISCLLLEKILQESEDGVSKILSYVNTYNEILYDVIIPKIFNTLYSVHFTTKTEDQELVLLRAPKGEKDFYEFSCEPDLVVKKDEYGFNKNYMDKSFHADTYCFDSKSERELFFQYLQNKKVSEIYFTGMFTSKQGDLYISYYDPESQRLRTYYPDFLAKMADGTYQLIEVKGDDKIDDSVVKAKSEAAEFIAAHSDFKYIMYPSSKIMKTGVL